ncbi:MAG: AAA family ATPase [Pseudomonadota bacterium]
MGDEDVPYDRVWLARVTIEGLRGFDRLDISLLDEGGVPRGQALVIGVNGTGKTTLLRAIALGLSERSDADALLAAPIGHMVANGRTSGSIRLELRDGHGRIRTVSTTIARNGHGDRIEEQRIEGEGRSPGLVCGYGSGRAVEGGAAGKGYRTADSVESLFRYNTPFNNIELSLRRLRDYAGGEQYEAWIGRLKGALGLGEHDRIELPQGGGVSVTGPTVGGEVEIEALADGYRMSLMWLLDIFAWAMRAGRLRAGHLSGILLVDEIDQHLHPAMQAHLLEGLALAMPEVQVLATTHSPLVALGLGQGLLVPLRRAPDGVHVGVAPGVPDLRAYSVEDVFEHASLFATSPYSTEVSAKLQRYRELVRLPQARRTSSQAAELRRLARDLDALQLVREPS